MYNIKIHDILYTNGKKNKTYPDNQYILMNKVSIYEVYQTRHMQNVWKYTKYQDTKYIKGNKMWRYMESV